MHFTNKHDDFPEGHSDDEEADEFHAMNMNEDSDSEHEEDEDYQGSDDEDNEDEDRPKHKGPKNHTELIPIKKFVSIFPETLLSFRLLSEPTCDIGHCFDLKALYLSLIRIGVTDIGFDKINVANNRDAIVDIVEDDLIEKVESLKFYNCKDIIEIPNLLSKVGNLKVLSFVQ